MQRLHLAAYLGTFGKGASANSSTPASAWGQSPQWRWKIEWIWGLKGDVAAGYCLIYRKSSDIDYMIGLVPHRKHII
jgi:hypothetical protein